jgi:parvulin-like peptidyl-prolyl isomerase
MKAKKYSTVGLVLVAAVLALPGLAMATNSPTNQDQGGKATKVHAEQNPNRILNKLVQILDDIRLQVKIHVRLGELVERLQSRKARYEIIGGDAVQGTVQVQGTSSGEKAVGVEKAAGVQNGKARLLGDEEKKGLAKDVIALVDGLPVRGEEIKRIANFFETFKPGLKDQHVKDAFLALIKVRHIQAAFRDKLPALEKRAQEIYKKAIAEGVDFAKLAAENSDGPSKSDGGNLGYFARPNMVPSFAARAFRMKLGEVSKPFPSIFGYHIIKVEGKLKGNSPVEDQVKARHILVIFTKDQNKTRSLAQEAAAGKAQVALVDKKDRAILPPSYR